MTKQEVKIIEKLIDLYTERYEYSCCNFSQSIPSENIPKLKKDIEELLEDED